MSVSGAPKGCLDHGVSTVLHVINYQTETTRVNIKRNITSTESYEAIPSYVGKGVDMVG